MFFGKIGSQHFFEAEQFVIRRRRRARVKALHQEVEKGLKKQLSAVRTGKTIRAEVRVQVDFYSAFPSEYEQELNKRGFLVEYVSSAEKSEGQFSPHTFCVKLGYPTRIPGSGNGQ